MAYLHRRDWMTEWVRNSPKKAKLSVVDEVGRVQDALGGVVEVLEEGEVVEDVLPEPGGRAGGPVEDPEQEQRPEGQDGGHDLVLGQGGEEEADGQEGRRP